MQLLGMLHCLASRPAYTWKLCRTADERREAAVSAGASPSSAIELLDSPVAHAEQPPRQQQHSRADNPEQRLRQQRPRQPAPGAAEELEQRIWGLAGIREERPPWSATQMAAHMAAQMASREEQLPHMRGPAGMMDERQVWILLRPHCIAATLRME